jgi:hypothetical protein
VPQLAQQLGRQLGRQFNVGRQLNTGGLNGGRWSASAWTGGPSGPLAPEAGLSAHSERTQNALIKPVKRPLGPSGWVSKALQCCPLKISRASGFPNSAGFDPPGRQQRSAENSRALIPAPADRLSRLCFGSLEDPDHSVRALLTRGVRTAKLVSPSDLEQRSLSCGAAWALKLGPGLSVRSCVADRLGV